MGVCGPKFIRNFSMTFNTMKKRVYAIWVDWDKYKPLRKIPMANPLLSPISTPGMQDGTLLIVVL